MCVFSLPIVVIISFFCARVIDQLTNPVYGPFAVSSESKYVNIVHSLNVRWFDSIDGTVRIRTHTHTHVQNHTKMMETKHTKIWSVGQCIVQPAVTGYCFFFALFDAIIPRAPSPSLNLFAFVKSNQVSILSGCCRRFFLLLLLFFICNFLI